MPLPPESEWVLADFNGIPERALLCLAHADTVSDQSGRVIALRPGLELTAFDLDADEEHRPDNIFASGVVEPSPPYAQCQGSRWALRIDADGIRHQSDLGRRIHP